MPRSIPRKVRNLQTSYNDSVAIFNDVTDEYDDREFREFALTTEATEEIVFLEAVTFSEAWDHPHHTEQKGWREAIRNEFEDMKKRKVWRRVRHSQIPSKVCIQEKREMDDSEPHFVGSDIPK